MVDIVSEQFKNEVKVNINEHGIQKGVETFFSNTNFDSWWITKQEYEEFGYYNEITTRKCI